MSLSDYQRGYRAAQHRGLAIAERHLPHGQYETYDEHALFRDLKVELAQPIPPDPHTLRQSGDES